MHWLSTWDATDGPAHEATFNKYYKELDNETKKVRDDGILHDSKIPEAFSSRNMQLKAAGWYVACLGIMWEDTTDSFCRKTWVRQETSDRIISSGSRYVVCMPCSQSALQLMVL